MTITRKDFQNGRGDLLPNSMAQVDIQLQKVLEKLDFWERVKLLASLQTKVYPSKITLVEKVQILQALKLEDAVIGSIIAGNCSLAVENDRIDIICSGGVKG